MAVWFLIGFLPKSPKISTVFNKATICNGKNKGLELLSQEQYTFENCIVLHKEVKNNTLWKLYCITQGSEKQDTFENDVALHKEAKNNTLDTYTRHLHETLTLDTYTRHLQ